MEKEFQEEGTILQEDESTEDTLSENPEQDDSDLYESVDDGTEEQEESVEEEPKVKQKPINKTAEKFKKVLDKNHDLKQRLDAMEKDLALERLAKTYWEIDTESVSQLKQENKTLTREQAVKLWFVDKPKVETKKQSSQFIWRESAWKKIEFVTDKDLLEASRNWTYDAIMEQIESWKLIHKK